MLVVYLIGRRRISYPSNVRVGAALCTRWTVGLNGLPTPVHTHDPDQRRCVITTPTPDPAEVAPTATASAEAAGSAARASEEVQRQSAETEVTCGKTYDEMTGAEFANAFVPRRGVDYRWVVKYANDRYDEAVTTFRMLEQRATTIVGYMTAGAGVLTVGALAGLIRGDVDGCVILAATPAALCALAAVVAVGLTIKPTRIARPYPITRAVMYAECYEKNDETDDGIGEAAYLALTNWVVKDLDPLVESKGNQVIWATWLSIISVILLVLPLILAVVLRVSGLSCLPAH